jgi:hypothetical protein
MVSIQKFATDFIEGRSNIKELLLKGLIDRTEMAKVIQELFINKYTKEVKLNTLVVAINRYIERNKLNPKDEVSDKDKNVTARYPVFWSYYLFGSHASLIDSLEYFQIDSDTLLTVRDQSMIIVNTSSNHDDYEGVLDIVEESHFENLCEISVDIQEEDLHRPGLLYKLTSSLFWKDYSVINTTVVGSKVLIYIEESNISGIIDMIKNEI